MGQLIFVVGMHRSGTSALAGALVRAGAWFGRPGLAIEGKRKPPLGLVERRDFVRPNERLLRRHGYEWHDMYGFPGKWRERALRAYRQEVETGVLADLLEHEVSVLKDPRLCFLLPFLPSISGHAVCIMIVRHPVEVAKSLNARNRFPIPFGIALWEAYNRQALISVQRFPSLLIQHGALLGDPEQCIQSVMAGLSKMGIVGLNRRTAAAAPEIEGSLYRQRLDPLEERHLAAWQLRFWEQLNSAHVPAEVPIESISQESDLLLKMHHEQRIAPDSDAANGNGGTISGSFEDPAPVF